MSDRITVRDLRAVCDRLNRLVGFPEGTELWTSWTDDDGKRRLRATVGMYYIDGAYGGWELHKMVNEGGGVSDVFRCGHVPARDLYGRMHAYLDGIEVAGGFES